MNARQPDVDAELTHTEDLLARAYLENLAEAEGVRGRAVSRKLAADDPMRDILAELEPDDEDTPRLRADLAAVAVLLARAVAKEQGLAKRLRRENPILSIATHTTDLVSLTESVFRACAIGPSSQPRYIEAREGTKTSDNPDRGNPDVIDRINRRHLICGIAPDPRRHLPSALMRMTEFRLSMPALDPATLRLVLSVVTGAEHRGEIDPSVVRAADFSDLLLAVRSGFTPEQCLDNLKRAIASKQEFSGEGPSLTELDGYGAAKQWGLDLAQDIADYKSGRLSWAEMDRKGLLLSGPPGVGKTQFAKALAKTCGVPLIATSVAQWNSSTYLSGSLQAIRDSFGRARRAAPAIMLIDEIDGISSRDSLRGEYIEYWTQLLNLLLEMLAGAEEREGVVVIAATNYPEKIDAAIKRAGRLDQEIAIEKPDAATLAKILRHHLGPDLLKGVDLMPAALASRGSTGADAEAFCRRAKAAARRGRRDLTLDDILEQIRQNRPIMNEAERHRAAIHEAGHALVGSMLDVGTLLGVSLHDGGGITEFEVKLDGSTTAGHVEDRIVIALAGRAAEDLALGSISIGSGSKPASDLGKATTLALLLETSWGFGSFGNVMVDATSISDISRHPWLIPPVQKRLDEAAKRAREMLSTRLDELKAVATALEKTGYLSPEDVAAIIKGDKKAAREQTRAREQSGRRKAGPA